MTVADVSKELEDLKADIGELREDLGALVGSVRDLAAERAGAVYSRAKDVGRKTRARAHLARETLEHGIEERPLASVLGSFGTGFALGMLLDRRR